MAVQEAKSVPKILQKPVKNNVKYEVLVTGLPENNVKYEVLELRSQKVPRKTRGFEQKGPKSTT